jgi:hypothetical protein
MFKENNDGRITENESMFEGEDVCIGDTQICEGDHLPARVAWYPCGDT